MTITVSERLRNRSGRGQNVEAGRARKSLERIRMQSINGILKILFFLKKYWQQEGGGMTE